MEQIRLRTQHAGFELHPAWNQSRSWSALALAEEKISQHRQTQKPEFCSATVFEEWLKCCRRWAKFVLRRAFPDDERFNSIILAFCMKLAARQSSDRIDQNAVQENFTNITSEMMLALDLETDQTPLAALVERCWPFDEEQIDSVVSAVSKRFLAELFCFVEVKAEDELISLLDYPIVSSELLNEASMFVDEIGDEHSTQDNMIGGSLPALFEYITQFPYESQLVNFSRRPIRRRLEVPVLADRMLVFQTPDGSPVLNMAMSPDGEKIALTTMSGDLVWMELVDGSFDPMVDEGRFNECSQVSLAWTPDGSYLFALVEDELVSWSAADGTETSIASVSEKCTGIIGFLDAHHIVLSHAEATFTVLDLAWPNLSASEKGLHGYDSWNLKGTTSLSVPDGNKSAVLSPCFDEIDQDARIISLHNPRYVAISNLSKKVLNLIQAEGCYQVASGDGGRIAVVAGRHIGGFDYGVSDDGVMQADPEFFSTHTWIDPFEGGRRVRVRYAEALPIRETAISPDGRWYAVAGDFFLVEGQGPIPDTGSDALVRVWDNRSYKPRCVLAGIIKSPITCVTFSPDSRYVFASDNGGRLLAWSLEPLHRPAYSGDVAPTESVATEDISVEFAKPSRVRPIHVPEIEDSPPAHDQKDRRDQWQCSSLGCDDVVSARIAGVHDFAERCGVDVDDLDISPDDYCPECYSEKVLPESEFRWWFASGRRQEGHGVENVRPGRYGPCDDTSPGDEDCTRRREGD